MADELTDARRTQAVIDQLSDARNALAAARRLLTELQGRLSDVEDLEWLVGMLAIHAQPDTALPPRLAPLVKVLVEKYLREGTGRFTVAVPIENIRPSADPAPT